MPRSRQRQGSAAAPATVASFPELPDFAADFAAQPGGQQTNARLQSWWDSVRQRLGLNEQSESNRFRTIQTAITRQDGYLESVWTMQAVAGPVVTGMTLFASTGPEDNQNVSYIAFQADRVLINTSSGGNKQIFATTPTEVLFGDVLTIDLANRKLFIGVGDWADANTPWYVDDDGFFSLKDKLYWNALTDELTVDGTIIAEDGIIGGWTIGPTTLTGGNATLDSVGRLVLGTTSDVLVASAADATYRLWIGNATAGSAAFSVTKAGALFSNSGTIAGFTINPTGFTVGTGASFVQIQSSGATIQFGQGTNYTSVLGATGLAFTNSGGIGSLGGFFGNSSGNNYLRVYNNSSALRMEMDATNGSLRLGDGSTGAPSFSFLSDTDTGWRWNSSGDMRAVTNGADRLVVRDGAVVLQVPLKLDNARAAGAPVAGGTVTLQDSTGTTVQVLVV